MKKIMIVGTFYPYPGGISHFTKELTNLDYNFIKFSTARPLKKDIIDNIGYGIIFNAGILRAFQGVLITIFHLFKFPFILLIKNPDIVHIQTTSYWVFWENTVYLLISKLFRKRILLHNHGGEFEKFYKKSHLKWLIKLTMKLANENIIVSKSMHDLISKEMKINTKVIPNFIDISLYSEVKQKNKDKYLNILFIGNLYKKKGVEDLIKAIPLIINKYKNVNFIFAGHGNKNAWCNTCKKMKIEKYVKFTGYLEEKNKQSILKNSDIFVLPSYSEGCPIVILEAMASGLPIIATKVGALPELINNNKNGFLINPGNYHEFAKKIQLLVANNGLRMKMKNNNLKKIKKYDKKKVLKIIKSIYEK